MADVESQDPFQLCGTTIEGKYRITAVVGDGGFGVVYRAVHQGFDEPVAVKCLKLPGKMSSKERDLLLAQLRDEGRLLLRLSRASSGIVQALDVGAFTTPEGLWVPYLILEWLEGETLAQFARRRREQGDGPLSIVETVKLLAPAARALAVAHAQKVAHRDVKPQNLFLAQVGSSRTLKVLDFGIAKVLADHPTFTQALAATNLGPTAFTPRYGAPEQFNKKRGATGPWTDVFALALIVVELASGKQALEGDDPTELYIASADPSARPTLRGRGIQAPEAVERVLAKALSVEPKHRYTDAGEFWDALAAATSEAGQEAAQRPSGAGAAEGGSGATQSMLSTAEFAAARELDVSGDAKTPAFAPTEMAPRVAATIPQTRVGVDAPRLAPTVPAEPNVAGLGGTPAASEPELLDISMKTAVETRAPGSAAGAASEPELLDISMKTAVETRAPGSAAGAASADALTRPEQGSASPASAADTLVKADTLVAPQSASAAAPAAASTSTPASTSASGTASASGSASASAPASASRSASAPAPASASAPAPASASVPASASAPASAPAPAKSAAPATARRGDDPMAETPLPERAPQVGASKTKKAAGAKPPEPAAPAKPPPPPPETNTKLPLAQPADEKRPTWMWIAGGLAAVALVGGAIFALGQGDTSEKGKGKGKGAPTASAVASNKAKPTPRTTPTASAAASAEPPDAGADAAPITPPDDMVYIPPPPLAVKLGAGDATREVTFTKGFFIDRNEVTVHAYQACIARRMCSAADHVIIPPEQEDAGLEGVSASKEFSDTWSRRCNEPRKALDHPVNCVDHVNAESFCRFRGRRLPTDAEWELAARGVSERPFPWGPNDPDCGRACFEKNGECLVRGESVTTCTAGSHPNDATSESVYDLGGNVAEWVADGFAAIPAGGADPKGDPASPLRVVRGGSFLDDKEKLRATYRVGVLPGTAHVSIGFRCAMDADGGAAAAPGPSAAPKSSAPAKIPPPTR